MWDFTFTLAADQARCLTGTTGSTLQGSAIALYAYDDAGDTSTVFFKDIGFASSPQTLDAGGILAAGRYWLFVQSQLSAYAPYSSGTSGYDLTFSIADAPEPATLALLALGGLVAIRPRRR